MIEYRNASLSELQQILGWAGDEGWNPGHDDAAAFFAADPKGFFVAHENGALRAAIAVVNHNPDFAFLGLYIVRPPYRGQGIGLGLWQHALAHAGGRCIGLDGVAEQQDNYRASGFDPAGGTTRYQGAVTAVLRANIRAARPADIPALIAQEAAASGQPKPAYLSAWLRDSASRKTLIMQNGADIAGFCTVRQCRNGAKIGPLLADDTDTAEALIRQAAHLFAGDLVIDVPDRSGALAALCRKLSMTPGFQTARMYRGPAPRGRPGVFAVTTLELG